MDKTDIKKIYDKVEEKVVETYKKVEEGAVMGYKAVEKARKRKKKIINLAEFI